MGAPGLLYPLHAGPARALIQLPEKFLQGIPLPLGHDLNATVGTIHDVPGNPHLLSHTLSEKAEPDPLDPADDPSLERCLLEIHL